MRLPKSFYAHRVTEAIDSVVKHVDQARDLAEDIKPARTVGPAWRSLPAPGRPELDSVTVSTDRKSVEVRGKNLSDVVSFALIAGHDLSDDRFLAELTKRNRRFVKDRLEADLDLSQAPPGTYHAWLRDEHGQEDLLVDAVEIPSPPTPAATTPASPACAAGPGSVAAATSPPYPAPAQSAQSPAPQTPQPSQGGSTQP